MSSHRSLTVAVYRTVEYTDVADPSECGGIELPTSEDPADQITAKTCAFWTEFRNFSPDPTAPFLKDFERLAQLESWSKNKKRKNLVKALNSEIDFHGEDKSMELVRWHRLCQEIGVDSKPTSVTACKRVRPRTLSRHHVIANAVYDGAVSLEALTRSRYSIPAM